MTKKQKSYPTGFPYAQVDTLILHSEEINALRKRCGDAAFTLYFHLCMEFANFDGCLAYMTLDGETPVMAKYFITVVKRGENTEPDVVVDPLLQNRLVNDDFKDQDQNTRFLVAMLDPSIHLLYIRADGFIAISCLTSDKNGPKLHLFVNDKRHLTKDNVYLPVSIPAFSNTVSIVAAIETKEDVKEISLNEDDLYLTVREFSEQNGFDYEYVRKKIQRRNLNKRLRKKGRSYLIPKDLKNDFVLWVTNKLSDESMKDKLLFYDDSPRQDIFRNF